MTLVHSWRYDSKITDLPKAYAILTHYSKANIKILVLQPNVAFLCIALSFDSRISPYYLICFILK